MLGLLFGYTCLLGLLPALKLQCIQAVNIPNAVASKAHRTHSKAFFGRREKALKAGQQGKQLLLEALPGRNHVSSAWQQPSEAFIPQQLGGEEL